jgi:hypothetical protein
MPQPFWNIESPENLSQIASKGYRSSESYATENKSRDKGHASVSKGVASETNHSQPLDGQRLVAKRYPR